MLRLVRVAVAVATLLAIIVQFRDRAERPTFNPINFFSFFTIESNLLLLVVFLAMGLSATRVASTAWASLRGAIAVYIATTGLVYATLLSGLEESLAMTLPWVNVVLHMVTPIAGIVDWLVDPPRERLKLGHVAAWLVFPVAYVAYSVIRGSRMGWYPYPFLNPGNPPAYGRVALYCVGIALTIGLIGLAVRTVGNRRAMPFTARTPSSS